MHSSMVNSALSKGSDHLRVMVFSKCLLFIIWLAVVAVGMWNHAFFRDEVRGLSLGSQARFLTLPNLLHGEGHPALWYLLLRGTFDVFGTYSVLPVTSAVIASIGVAIFVWRAPFPLWWKPLFVFSGLPLFEYSVMARNYGLS